MEIKIKTIYGNIDVERLLRYNEYNEEEGVKYFDFVEGNGYVPLDRFMKIMERWAFQRSMRMRRE